MDSTAFITASPIIQLHIIAAMIAFVAGGVQFALPKGTVKHKQMGYLWATTMAIVAASGLLIFEIRVWGPFSPIHLLSLLTLFMLYRAIQAARAHKIKRHLIIMINLYIFGIIIVGAISLRPGRLMHQIIFGSSQL